MSVTPISWPASCLSNSSSRLISMICPGLAPSPPSVLAPFCRKCFSRRTAFLVLHLYIASARSPMNGTRPITKSIAMLMTILSRSEDGRPPSISSQVWRTSNASSASAPSPILKKFRKPSVSWRTEQGSTPTYNGNSAITLLQPNLIPHKLKRLRSSLYALRLTFVRTLLSFSDNPGGTALRRFWVFLPKARYRRDAGTCSK